MEIRNIGIVLFLSGNGCVWKKIAYDEYIT